MVIDQNSPKQASSAYTPAFYSWPQKSRTTPYKGKAKSIEKIFSALSENVHHGGHFKAEKGAC